MPPAMAQPARESASLTDSLLQLRSYVDNNREGLIRCLSGTLSQSQLERLMECVRAARMQTQSWDENGTGVLRRAWVPSGRAPPPLGPGARAWMHQPISLGKVGVRRQWRPARSREESQLESDREASNNDRRDR